jgi:hypothetical protein
MHSSDEETTAGDRGAGAGAPAVPVDWRPSRDRLREIARSIWAGTVVTSAQIPESEIRSMFVGLMFLDDEGVERMKAREPVVFYGDLKDAGPWAVNGHAQFFSFGYLNAEDWGTVRSMVEKLQAASEEL